MNHSYRTWYTPRNTLGFFISTLAAISACSVPPEQGDSPSGSGGTNSVAPGTGNMNGNGTPGSGGSTTGPIRDVDQSGPPFGHPDPDFSYPSYEDFTLWLVEEFEEPLNLDTDPIWTWSDGGLDEGQVRFVKEGVKFEDGKMKLVVSEDAPSVPPQSCSHAEVNTVFSKPLTSGEMRTRHNLFRYGRYEVRMKAPSVQPGDTAINGNYVATLFIFRTPKFQYWREIDIEVTGDGVDTVTTNLITADNTFAWNANIQEVTAYKFDGINVREDFHDFAFEWLPDRITWYLDGEVVSERVTGDGLPIPEKSAKIMMNLWVFNNSAAFGGKDIANNRYPMESEYEWFRFYKWNGENDYPCNDMNELCLADEDMQLSSNNPCDEIPQMGQVNGNDPCQASCQ